LQGEVIYIDQFGNLITNIQKDVFRRFVRRSNFRICLGEEAINKISKSYLQTKKNKPLAIFGSFGTLEISVSCGSARNNFRAKKGQQVKVLLYKG
jgi:S-adenosylmethionine hydrolase